MNIYGISKSLVGVEHKRLMNICDHKIILKESALLYGESFVPKLGGDSS